MRKTASQHVKRLQAERRRKLNETALKRSYEWQKLKQNQDTSRRIAKQHTMDAQEKFKGKITHQITLIKKA